MDVVENKPSPTLQELREACDEGHLIVCVGPALSVSAGLPAPAAVARQLVAVAVEHGYDVDVERLEDRLERGHVAEVLGVLRTRMGRSFEREIEVRLCDRGQTVPELAKTIAALRSELRAVYTTALDRLIERAFAGAWPSFADARADLAQRRAVIFKLRGTLEFAQSWVLTREQHECELSPRSLRQAIFEAAYNAHRIIFVGFDADDETLTRLLDTVGGATEPGHGPSHYIVLPRCERAERERFERRGLHVLSTDAVELLQSLRGDGVDDPGRREISVSGSPYLGLEPFSESDAELFFGRQAEVSQAASRLGGLDRVHRRWLCVEGPSGVGKSSFVRAGVVPALRRGFAAGTPTRWRVATMRPGARPCHALAAALHEALEIGESATAESLADEFSGSRKALSERLERHAMGSGVLLVLDQLEEVVTLAAESERVPFDGVIAHALETGALYLVTTIRSDFVPAFQVVMPGLAGMLNEHAERYALPPISRVGLREAIAAPAMLLGVELEAPLVERLVLDAEELGAGRVQEEEDGEVLTRPSTLPLVAHVLRGLWDAGAHHDKVIELSEYEALGGLSGALSRSADGLLQSLDEADRDRAKALLLQMVRVENDRADTRRTLHRDEALAIAGEDVL
ncbi:MAG: SIR2 family protein, partial [Myxococcota bacterium]